MEYPHDYFEPPEDTPCPVCEEPMQIPTDFAGFMRGGFVCVNELCGGE